MLCFFLNPHNNFIVIFVFLLSSSRLARRGGCENNSQHLLLVIIKLISFYIFHSTLKKIDFLLVSSQTSFYDHEDECDYSYLHLSIRNYIHSRSNLIPLILRSSDVVKAVKRKFFLIAIIIQFQ